MAILKHYSDFTFYGKIKYSLSGIIGLVKSYLTFFNISVGEDSLHVAS